MSCLVEHYERQITLNATVIADTYESLDKIEGWTERDKQQLEEEVKSIIDGKEQKIKEAKQKKLGTDRKNKETVQPPRRENETYADVLKRHIRERLNPVALKKRRAQDQIRELAKGGATYPLDDKTHGAAHAIHHNRGILNSDNVF